ncbi:MAG: hypothetical protein V1872_04055 [bacterium]
MKPNGVLILSDGLWLNHGWKQFHLFLLETFNKLIAQENFITSLRFFHNYVGLQKTLPFYKGVCFEKAKAVLQQAGFKKIASYDISCFKVNPYLIKSRFKKYAPSFFIAYGRN